MPRHASLMRGATTAVRRCYERSLELHTNAEVREAYLRLLATTGPL